MPQPLSLRHALSITPALLRGRSLRSIFRGGSLYFELMQRLASVGPFWLGCPGVRVMACLMVALSFTIGFTPKADHRILEPIAVPSLSTWTNSLGMRFVVGLEPGLSVAVWETRVKDFREYTKSKYLTAKAAAFEQTDTHPVVGVTWYEAKKFCEWLTERERRRGVISATASYRLPFDSEWTLFLGRFREPEGLPRFLDENGNGGYLWGLEWPPPLGAGNFGPDMKIDSFEHTAPVGSFEANLVGLYDIPGNVWEWCEDWYDENQRYRVLRGGSWRVETYRNNLATERHAHLPEAKVDCYGFRCVLFDPTLVNGE